MADVDTDTGTVGAQLASLADKVADIKADVAVIRERTQQLDKLDSRVTRLERMASRYWSLWAVALVLGAVGGWLAAHVQAVH